MLEMSSGAICHLRLATARQGAGLTPTTDNHNAPNPLLIGGNALVPSVHIYIFEATRTVPHGFTWQKVSHFFSQQVSTACLTHSPHSTAIKLGFWCESQSRPPYLLSKLVDDFIIHSCPAPDCEFAFLY